MTVPDGGPERARHYWGRLCSAVAGDLGEFLFEEISDAEGGDWPTPAERAGRLRRDESTTRAWSGDRILTPGVNAPRYPSGDLGQFHRYVATVTGRVLPVTARLWWCVARNEGAGGAASHDSSKALEYALRVWSSGEAARPFAQNWPADAVDEDGLFPEFHVIRYAELEAERILKRDWDDVCAVARGLYRCEGHRLTGRQVDALLRGRGGPPAAARP